MMTKFGGRLRCRSMNLRLSLRFMSGGERLQVARSRSGFQPVRSGVSHTILSVRTLSGWKPDYGTVIGYYKEPMPHSESRRRCN